MIQYDKWRSGVTDDDQAVLALAWILANGTLRALTTHIFSFFNGPENAQAPERAGDELLVEVSPGRCGLQMSIFHRLLALQTLRPCRIPRTRELTWLLSITCGNPLKTLFESYQSLQPMYLHTASAV